MPVATVSEDLEEFHLKSLPEGIVWLKRMTYGQKLQRQQTTTKMSMLMKKGQKDVKGMLETLQTQAALYDFKTCVVRHNLTDPSGRELNFASPQDMSILDPRVGDEIAGLLDKMNNFEEYEDEDGESGNSPSASD